MKTKRSRLSRLPVPSSFYSIFLSSLYSSYTQKTNRIVYTMAPLQWYYRKKMLIPLLCLLRKLFLAI